MAKPVPKAKKELPEAKAIPERTLLRRLCIVLAALSFLLYANTLKNGYVLDDMACITKNTIVTKGVAAIPELLSTPYHQGYSPYANDLYRPLAMCVFAIEHQLFPGNAMVGHMVNVLCYMLCVVALFLLLYYLFGKRYVGMAFVATVLFAVHPIHTEVVANIKSLDELLCFLFGMVACLQLMRYVKSGNTQYAITGATCMLLSLLAKETSITFVAIIPLVLLVMVGTEKKRSIVATIVVGIVAAVYLAVRHSVLHGHHADNMSNVPFVDNALASIPDGASKLATAILMLGKYLLLLIVPYPLLCDYSFSTVPYAGWGHWGFLLSLVVYAGMLVLIVVRMRKDRKDPLAFGLLFYLIAISLFSNIVFLLGATMAERFLFFPSAGMCIAAAYGLQQLVIRRGGAMESVLYPANAWMIAGPIAIVFFALTVSRNGEWADNYTLYTQDVNKAQGNMRLHYYLGNELVTNVLENEQSLQGKRGALLGGIAELQRSISIYPRFVAAHQDLGHAFFMMQEMDSAEVHDRIALRLQPDNGVTLSNLAGVFFTKKQYDSAIYYCKQALKQDAANADIQRNIAHAYLQMKQYDSSLVYFRHVLAVHADNVFVIESMAMAFQGAGLADSAKKYEAIAQRSEPGFHVK